jgi:hypothetical protein
MNSDRSNKTTTKPRFVFAVLLCVFSLAVNNLWLLRPSLSLSPFVETQQPLSTEQHGSSKSNIQTMKLEQAAQKQTVNLQLNETDELHADSGSANRDTEEGTNIAQHEERKPAVNTDDHPSGLKTAICHKTIFGAVDLDILRRWCDYNHALGFDHIYIWYEASVTEYPGFLELRNLPYVTLILNENVKAVVVRAKSTNDFKYVRMVSRHAGKHALGSQQQVEKQCLRMTDSLGYDWVLNADADEYLWFNETIGVKDFLMRYEKSNYISLGKHMHTVASRVEALPGETESGFGLDYFAFTEGPFCRVSFWKPTNCYGDKGSCKVMVRPGKWKRKGVKTHGWGKPNAEQTKVHPSTEIAHLKEFPFIYHSFNVTVRPRQDFIATSRADLWLVRNSLRNRQSGFTMYYDDSLLPWFQYVAGRKREKDSEWGK